MVIWSAEIKELETLYHSLKGKFPDLEKELIQLIDTKDANVALLYSRRSLEVIITDVCERELKKPRGTKPLKGIIDKLNREEKVPHNIIASMQNINSLSTFGTHPKDFKPRQVKPVLLDLTTVLEWYLEYMQDMESFFGESELMQGVRKESAGIIRRRSKSGKRIIMVTSVLLVTVIIIVSLIVFDIIGSGKQARAGSIESVLILPFGNYTGDEALDPHISGMHATLITEIQRLSGLRVICKKSSDAFKNSDMTVHEIAREMKVDAVIEPSVLCWGDSICTTFTMVSGDSKEEQIWIADYREEKSKLFNMFNQITKQIAEEVKIELTDKEKHLLAEYKTVDPDALDAYLKGNYYWEQLHPDSLRKGLDCFQSAIEKELDWAPPYAGMANAWFLQGFTSVIPWKQALPKTYQYLNKALELDPNSAYSHYVAALVAVWAEWDWEKGEKEFRKSLELNPNDALCRLYYAHLLICLNRHDEAVVQANLGKELNPLEPLVLGLYAVVMKDIGDYPAATTSFEKALSINPYFGFFRGTLEFIYFECGQYEKWMTMWKQRVCWSKEIQDTIEKVLHEQGHIAAIEKLIKFNVEYGTEECHMDGIWYLRVGDYEKGLDYLENLYETANSYMPYIATNCLFRYEELKDNLRYITLLKKMNLPLPKSD